VSSSLANQPPHFMLIVVCWLSFRSHRCCVHLLLHLSSHRPLPSFAPILPICSSPVFVDWCVERRTAAATAVADARHLPPPQPRSLRGFIVVVLVAVVVVIVTAVPTVSPPLSCDLFDCCVLFCHRVLSPSSFGGGHPTH